MHCGNLSAVARALRARFPTREITVAADNDGFTTDKGGNPTNPGVIAATEAAKAIGARLAAPTFADVSTKPTDFNDLHRLQGLDTVKDQIEAASIPPESELETFARLANLSGPEMTGAVSPRRSV